jgi:hypothetical protein
MVGRELARFPVNLDGDHLGLGRGWRAFGTWVVARVLAWLTLWRWLMG